MTTGRTPSPGAGGDPRMHGGAPHGHLSGGVMSRPTPSSSSTHPSKNMNSFGGKSTSRRAGGYLPPPAPSKTADLVQSKLLEFFFEWLSKPETANFLKQLETSTGEAIGDTGTGSFAGAKTASNQQHNYGVSKPLLPDSHVNKHPPGSSPPPTSSIARSPTSEQVQSPPASPQKKRISPEKQYNEGWAVRPTPIVEQVDPGPGNAGGVEPSSSGVGSPDGAQQNEQWPIGNAGSLVEGGSSSSSARDRSSWGRSSSCLLENTVAGRFREGDAQLVRFYEPRKQEPSALSPEQRQLLREVCQEHIWPGGTAASGEVLTKADDLVPFLQKFLKLSKYLAQRVWRQLCAIAPPECRTPLSSQGGQSPPTAAEDGRKMEEAEQEAFAYQIPLEVLEDYCSKYCDPDDPDLTFFYIAKSERHNYLTKADFRELIDTVLEEHPGLDFLKGTREFQEKYADTVIARIFFTINYRDDGRIPLSDLRRRKPSIVETWTDLDHIEDMKMVRKYFSYEHFYVIYCTFWELDNDHDCLLDKDDILKYDTHALSRKAADRIFAEIPRKFTSGHEGRMCYEDFIYFLLCDQDRLQDRSLAYWFTVMDLDSDGFIRPWEMWHFFEEQAQRLNFLQYDTIHFEDIACQVSDMMQGRVKEFVLDKQGHLKPEFEDLKQKTPAFGNVPGSSTSPTTFGTIQKSNEAYWGSAYSLGDFLRSKKAASAFFSTFISLQKFLAWEHRDPFQMHQATTDTPHLSDWDRWCQHEYGRLAVDEAEEGEEHYEANEYVVDESAGIASVEQEAVADGNGDGAEGGGGLSSGGGGEDGGSIT
ncbi:unnamed protein product [Amoebophrya sp. A25]|nr:unnamed protein product [Amoebophrya sp. A25]|eukprot:GSA25T00014961001.1